MKTKTEQNFALARLKSDPVMAQLIRQFSLSVNQQETNLLEDLVSTIISQQLSTKAADTIYRRFLDIFEGKFPTPRQLLDIEEAKVRQAGISYSKISYIKGIAAAITEGSLDLANIATLADEEVVVNLTKLKGVGRWTAEMILMFSLYRQDVFSMGDLGLRTAVSRLYGVDRDDLVKIAAISDKWHPYRTLACRLLWKSLDNT